ncbi:hypothetical protein VOLCADRAFT_96687 [Volvox carteri f. nagariensis]|uniref:Uncharacterized protein n=1 Tax=Volvox carteri f. nagariensis TaxID=3068 RepID=D8UAS9_VOLCA|nr:uncharacterized protein VOLCADRAFT_96687 [Volvox carteri f. nagariensis]EFJ43154.1 hypothetical protein VOLCADRAFT_96687 [Volvox carteri f. nagariensis]|eukprot:XP_002955729.1 hypothetical protein VOLCADRAFT_96687 [Volvox carteri f. nagariensis]
MRPEQYTKEMIDVVNAISDTLKKKNKIKVPISSKGYKGFLLLHSVKGAAVLGFERGHGMAFKVLETQPDGTNKLSAPVMVKTSKVAIGLQLGAYPLAARFEALRAASDFASCFCGSWSSIGSSASLPGDNSVYSIMLLMEDSQLEALVRETETIIDFEVSGYPGVNSDNITTFHKSSMSAVNDGFVIKPAVISASDSLMVCDISLYDVAGVHVSLSAGGVLSVE